MVNYPMGYGSIKSRPMPKTDHSKGKSTVEQRTELDTFKTDINLTQYAASLGYQVELRASSKNSVTMRHSDGDKIIVARGLDQHWVYFSVRDHNDNGTIIDFVKNRQGGSLGDIRRKLRPWVGGPPDGQVPPSEAYVPSLEPTSRDRLHVQKTYAAMTPLHGHHDYLEQHRRIPPHLLTDPRFADRISRDRYGNAVFPHYNGEGLIGYELKNKGFTGFAKGGEKGLWCTHPGSQDTTLVLTETAIDALSYAALFGPTAARYASIAGQLSPAQKELLIAAFNEMPEHSKIILAFDNDAGGRSLFDQIDALYPVEDRRGCVLTYHPPTQDGADWNDVLKQSSGPSGLPETTSGSAGSSERPALSDQTPGPTTCPSGGGGDKPQQP